MKTLRKWMWWAVTSIGLVMFYLASAGPVCYGVFRWEPQSRFVETAVEIVYLPVIQLLENQMAGKCYTDFIEWCGNRGIEAQKRDEEAAKAKASP